MLRSRTPSRKRLLLAAWCLLSVCAAAAAQQLGPKGLPNPTHAGYLDVERNAGSKIYYQYYEADSPYPDVNKAPIILWLQGGPGCSSLFGTFYLNGPYALQTDLSLQPNPGRWNRQYGMLFVDQPIGTGFSVAGSQPIPNNELDVARDLYASLQEFYRVHEQYKERPLYITGESYAGKYVPSIAHYIVQAAAMADGTAHKLRKVRALPADVEAPVFRLGGLAIGNGFTEAVEQTLVQAEVAFNLGLIDTRQRLEAEAIQADVVELVRSRQWNKARKRSDELLAYITQASGSATLEDIRRDKGYDAEDRVSAFLNLPEVKANINAPPDLVYAACSKEVDAILGHDVMKSVAHLVPDLLERSHVLLYQGQFDAECGVASNEAWISKLQWTGHTGFNNAERRLWRDELFGSQILGYLKTHKHLTHLIIRNAGHMVPHDRPVVSQRMIETWIESAEQGLDEFDVQAAQRKHQQLQQQEVSLQQQQMQPALSGVDSSPHKQTQATIAVA
jgi:vitellogenic carboxypeptidase-like protein